MDLKDSRANIHRQWDLMRIIESELSCSEMAYWNKLENLQKQMLVEAHDHAIHLGNL